MFVHTLALLREVHLLHKTEAFVVEAGVVATHAQVLSANFTVTVLEEVVLAGDEIIQTGNDTGATDVAADPVAVVGRVRGLGVDVLAEHVVIIALDVAGGDSCIHLHEGDFVGGILVLDDKAGVVAADLLQPLKLAHYHVLHPELNQFPRPVQHALDLVVSAERVVHTAATLVAIGVHSLEAVGVVLASGRVLVCKSEGQSLLVAVELVDLELKDVAALLELLLQLVDAVPVISAGLLEHLLLVHTRVLAQLEVAWLELVLLDLSENKLFLGVLGHVLVFDFDLL